MKIYFVRHGQTDSNLNGVFNISDEDINDNGIKQAEEIREKIKELDYEVVYCSPLKRTIQTANIINVQNKNIIYDERLVERKFPGLVGKPLETVNREEYWNYYSDKRFEDEETVKELFERVHGFLNELKNKNYKCVLIVAHGGVSRGFYSYFNGIPEDGIFLKLGQKNCEIREYEF